MVSNSQSLLEQDGHKFNESFAVLEFDVFEVASQGFHGSDVNAGDGVSHSLLKNGGKLVLVRSIKSSAVDKEDTHNSEGVFNETSIGGSQKAPQEGHKAGPGVGFFSATLLSLVRKALDGGSQVTDEIAQDFSGSSVLIVLEHVEKEVLHEFLSIRVEKRPFAVGAFDEIGAESSNVDQTEDFNRGFVSSYFGVRNMKTRALLPLMRLVKAEM